MLHALQGHCNSPIAGYATTELSGKLSMHGKVFSLDGTQWLDSHHWGVPGDYAFRGAIIEPEQAVILATVLGFDVRA